ncbi:4,5-DOPA dioxygenase extradiol [Ruminococcaceae bacterium OttesenSCG-928-A16]|nr:4,5-DOPA dioxygenase extradiol [Ruminococcaceae bacterium OttesenSCG-928-A16]
MPVEKMPVLFVGHGSPTNIIEDNPFTEGWQQIAKEIPTPTSILCISAHWYTGGQLVSQAEKPETIYDFYGFPQELYEISYPAPGAPALAQQAAPLFTPPAMLDSIRGLDHGAWSVLHFMYPNADIPVCQLSVNNLLLPQQSYQMGQLLAPLRQQGTLLLGSGNIVHNLGLVNWQLNGGYPWADEFDDYAKQAIVTGQHSKLVNYQQAGASAQKAFVTKDHYDPLLYVLGAAGTTSKVRVFNDARVLGSISMTSYLFED